MPLSSGPTGSRYVPPAPANTGPRDVARAIADLLADGVARAQEIRTAVQKTGCDGLPNINPLDGTECADIGGPLVLVHKGWLFEARIPRNLTGAGGSAAVRSETILPTPCEAAIAGWDQRLRFLDSKGNLFGSDGLFISSGNAPATHQNAYTWNAHGGEGGLTGRFMKATGSPVLLMGSPPGPVWNSDPSTHFDGSAVGVNEEATCFADPNTDLILTTEMQNFDGINAGGSHRLVVRRTSDLAVVGYRIMQYDGNVYYFSNLPRFSISATADGSFWVHLFNGEGLASPPNPFPNWEYVTAPGAAVPSTPGTGNNRLVRVTVDRETMTPTIVGDRRVTFHADMTAWDDDTFLIAYLADEEN